MAAVSFDHVRQRAGRVCVMLGLCCVVSPGCSEMSPLRQKWADIRDVAAHDKVAPGTAGDRTIEQPNGPGEPLLGRRIATDPTTETAAQPGNSPVFSEAARARISARMASVSDRLKQWFSRNPRSPQTPQPAAAERPIEVALQPPVELGPAEGSSVRGIPVRRASQAQPGRAALPGAVEAEAAPTPKPAEPTAEQIVAAAQKRLDGMSAYQVHMTRQERVKDQLLPEEKVVLSIRRNPKAVRLEWAEGPHKGREVIYAADQGDGLMYIHMGDSLVPVPRLSMRPDSPMAMAQSRHPITEAGLDTIVANLQSVVTANHSGDESQGTLSYEGLKPTEGLDHPCHTLTRRLPDGERWLVAIDPRTDLPALVQATDAQGQLLERYKFADLKPDLPELASTDAFNPDARWGQPQGLFGRLARTGNPSSKPAETLQQ